MPLFQRSSKDVSQDDIIIALMGPTGVGKSTFIDKATNQGGRWVGDALDSYTLDIQTIRVPYPRLNRSIVFVDTPGFDNTFKSDTDILKSIAKWLEKTYRKDIKLTAIIYLHRISDNRMAGAPRANLRVFEKLCGDDAIKRGKVVLATTMWDKIQFGVGEMRENELKGEYWKRMVDLGSKMHRFHNTPESAWGVIDQLVDWVPYEVLLQVEMVKLKRRLNETQAGMALYTELQALQDRQREKEEQLRNALKTQNDPDVVKQLHEEYNSVQKRRLQTLNQINEMQISLARRILLWFKK